MEARADAEHYARHGNVGMRTASMAAVETSGGWQPSSAMNTARLTSDLGSSRLHVRHGEHDVGRSDRLPLMHVGRADGEQPALWLADRPALG